MLNPAPPSGLMMYIITDSQNQNCDSCFTSLIDESNGHLLYPPKQEKVCRNLF